MLQVAVFVDAGYLYAQGSVLLAGQKQPRTHVTCNIVAVLDQLRKVSREVEPGGRLLRIYWYDGMRRGGQLHPEQTTLAQSPDVKLRLGLVNGKGQQKGVDSLIVTDLIDLARNQAVSDAVIISGDEDIRIGVQIAQTFGVRVHLVGIKPARGSQSPDLIQEADTHREWADEVVTQWLAISAPPPPPLAASPTSPPPPPPASSSASVKTFEASVGFVVAGALHGRTKVDLARVVKHMDDNRNQIPPDVDRPTLAKLADDLDRELTNQERKQFRVALNKALRDAALP